MGFRADIGDHCKRGSSEECECNSLEDPNNQERPKRGSDEIGSGSEGQKECASNHKVFFRNF
jgi:hypothetical protein